MCEYIFLILQKNPKNILPQSWQTEAPAQELINLIQK